MVWPPSRRGAVHDTTADPPPGTATTAVGASNGVTGVTAVPMIVRYGGDCIVAFARAFQLSAASNVPPCPSSDMTPVNWVGVRCWLAAQSLSCFHSAALAV